MKYIEDVFCMGELKDGFPRIQAYKLIFVIVFPYNGQTGQIPYKMVFLKFDSSH